MSNKEEWLDFIKECISRRTLSNNLSEKVENRSKICSNCSKLNIIKRMGFSLSARCKSSQCCFPMILYVENKQCPDGKW